MTYFTEEMIDELRRCKDDPIYFIEKYIQPGLTVEQKSVIEDVIKNQKVDRLFDRQMGKTTVGIALIVHIVVFHFDKTTAIINKKMDQSREALQILRKMIAGLPEWMQPKYTVDNKTSLRFDNGNHVIAVSAGSLYGLRGRSINFTFADEFLFWERRDLENFQQSFYPVIMSGRYNKLLMLSTW